jgi:glutaredoxin
MGWLRRLRDRRGTPGPTEAEADVVVVSRVGCHLCVEMEQVVGRVLAEPAGRGHRGARLRVVDLDELGRDDPSVLERWTTQVPVLLVDGREVAHWQVDPDAVRRALRR